MALAGLDRLRLLFPPNWPRDWVEDEAVQVMMHGIPTAWVPRATVLSELAKASSYPEAARCLVTHRAEILDDIRSLLADTRSGSDRQQLAEAAAAALASGHDEAALALACLVAAGLTETYVGGSHRIKQHGAGKINTPPNKADEPPRPAGGLPLGDDDEFRWVTILMGWYPVMLFFQDTLTGPTPVQLSRHAIAHEAPARNSRRQTLSLR